MKRFLLRLICRVIGHAEPLYVPYFVPWNITPGREREPLHCKRCRKMIGGYSCPPRPSSSRM